MAENYVIKAKALDQPHIHGFFRTPFNGPLHKNVETLERPLGFAIVQHDVSHVLKGSENGIQDELNRDQFAGREAFAEDKPEKNEEDRLFQESDDGSLEKREHAHAF